MDLGVRAAMAGTGYPPIRPPAARGAACWASLCGAGPVALGQLGAVDQRKDVGETAVFVCVGVVVGDDLGLGGGKAVAHELGGFDGEAVEAELGELGAEAVEGEAGIEQ